MSRRFPDFITAYEEYANNGFIPPQFNLWSCLSVIAGALERRVWLPWDDTFSYFPNIYVMLVSMPGDGKSVALGKAVDLLQEVNRRTSTLNIMPNQVTEAKFIELMGHGRSFTEHTAGREITHRQNAGYYWASEASNSLRNIFGDFIACLTDFYDCPRTWERATKKDGKKIQLTNVCMNLIAGSTFDYLGKLVSDDNIMGGFASRLIYIISKNKEVVAQEFQLGRTQADTDAEKVYREALIQDLTAISKLTGPMIATPEFGRAWESWYPEYERKRRAIKSEKVQSLLARANTNILKVAMLLSASESDDRTLRLAHWDRACALVMDVYEQTPAIFREVRATATVQAPSGLANRIIYLIETNPTWTLERVKASLCGQGANKNFVDQTTQALIETGVIGFGAARAGGREAKILTNPNDNL